MRKIFSCLFTVSMALGVISCQSTQEIARENSINPACPNFGQLSNVRPDQIFKDERDNESYVYVTDRQGEPVIASLKLATMARTESDSENLRYFLDKYKTICGGAPEYIAEINQKIDRHCATVRPKFATCAQYISKNPNSIRQIKTDMLDARNRGILVDSCTAVSLMSSICTFSGISTPSTNSTCQCHSINAFPEPIKELCTSVGCKK